MSMATVFALVQACSDQKLPEVAKPEPGSFDAIRRAASSSPSTHLRAIRSARWPNGSVEYTEYRFREEGRLSQYIAVYPDGKVARLKQARAAFNDAYEQEYGSLALKAARILETKSDLKGHEVVVWVPRETRPRVNVLDYMRSLPSAFDIEEAKGPAAISAKGLTSGEVLQLAKTEGVTRVDVFETPNYISHGVTKGSTPSTAFQVPQHAEAVNAHQIFNRLGYHGQNQVIGIIDPVGATFGASTAPGCRIFEEHEAFTRALVSYTDPTIIRCLDDTECTNCAANVGIGVVAGQCVVNDPMDSNKNYCVNTHATRVASRSSSYQECGIPGSCDPEFTGSYMATEASYVYYNSDGVNSFAKLDAAYDDLVVNEGVSIIIEAWGEGLTNSLRYSARDLLTDWYTRHHNVTFVRSARNYNGAADTEDDSNPLLSNYDTGCYSLNSLCVGSIGSTPPNTRAAADFELWSSTSWTNPEADSAAVTGASCVPPASCPVGTVCQTSEANSPRNEDVCVPEVLEVSKPDLVGPAGNHLALVTKQNFDLTMSTTTLTNRWLNGSEGNSYAAPVVAGLLAQYQDFCGESGSLIMRAAALGAGYRTPKLEERFPTGGTIDDGRDDRRILRNMTRSPNAADLAVCENRTIFGYGSPVAEFFLFPNAESLYDCDYAAGVGLLSAAPLGYMCGGVTSDRPDGPECFDDPATSGNECCEPLVPGVDCGDIDWPPLQYNFGDEPWNVLTPNAADAVTSKERISFTATSGQPLSTSVYADLLEGSDIIDDVTSAFALSPTRTRDQSDARVLPRPLGSLDSGEFIRVAFVYNSCPDVSNAAGAHGIANNIDIALVGVRADGSGDSDVLFISESLHDTKEIIMVKAARNYSSVNLVYIFPGTFEACPDINGVAVVGPEPSATEIVTWP